MEFTSSKNKVKDTKMFCKAECNCRVGDSSLWVHHPLNHISHFLINIKALIIEDLRDLTLN